MTKTATVLLLLHIGCLLPPAGEEIPPTDNLPPRVLLESLFPDPTDGPVAMSRQCPSYQFFARLSDPDPQDTLYWRVFVDYHRDGQALQRLVTPVGPADRGQTPVIFFVDPLDPRLSPPAGGSTVHMVELLVADRPFRDDLSIPLARSVEEDGLLGSFIWTVDLEDTACANAGPSE